jgi:hypothetical protein
MAQAATANTDELLSQLASSEIDRLLAEADGNPAPPEKKIAEQTPSKEPPPDPEPAAKGSERAALLQAAGFESTTATPDAPPIEDERAALLHAAGFESPEEMGFHPKTNTAGESSRPERLPVYLKPLIWINAPLDACPSVVRQMLGKVGIVTLFNALAVLAYVFFFRKK